MTMASRDDGVVAAKAGGAEINPSAVASPQPATRDQKAIACIA